MDISLKPNKQYFISYNNKKYIGTYKETTTNLNRTEIYKFEMISEIPKNAPLRPFSRSYSFPVNNTILQPYTSNNNSSVLGKRQTTTPVNNNDEQNKKISKTDMTFTEEEILKDREYWESVDGGKRKSRKIKRKTKKSKKRKTRKYNK